MYRSMRSRGISVVLALAVLMTTLLWSGSALAASSTAGAVYTLTNAAAGNQVAIFNRDDDGTLTPAGTVATGGLGSGGGLGSQGALVLSEDDRWLFVVNAGSNDISSFAVRHDGLKLVDRVDAGGLRPISLTVHNDLLYVLNTGGSGNISGFRVGSHGALTPLAGSTRPLSGSAVGPAQVQFSPDGDLLIVTEKNTNLIDSYRVAQDGLATGPTAQPSAGGTPFGFAFAKRNHLIVSEAFGGAAGAGAVSSYRVSDKGTLKPASASAPDHQTAPCWVAVTENGRYAYTANAGSDSISGYEVAQDGSLSLLNANGVTGSVIAGSHPIDMGFSRESRYLYVLNSGNGTIAGFRVRSNGSLSSVAGASALPASVVGLAAR